MIGICFLDINDWRLFSCFSDLTDGEGDRPIMADTTRLRCWQRRYLPAATKMSKTYLLLKISMVYREI